jgi:peptidoglycan/xylan/chitin deacetylase (PgdA/CDA1 family)
VTDVVALCYHGVSATWPSSLAVTPQQLEEQVGWFVRRGYRPVTVRDAARARGRGKRVAITFDDALRSVSTLALPVLQRLGAVATVYAPSQYIADGAPMAWPEVRAHLATEHAAELDPMSVAQLPEVAAQGWEIGSHTCTHPWLPRLDDARLAAELGDSKRQLAEVLELPIDTLAYPFGAYDERVAEATAAAGYAAAVTLPDRVPAWPHAPDALARMTLPRIGLYRADDYRRFRLKVSRPVRVLRRSPLWDGITAVRRWTQG